MGKIKSMFKYLNHRISTLVGIVIIIAIAILAYSTFFAYQYFAISKLNNIKVVETNKKVVETNKNENNPKVIDWEVAYWKTYTNTEYGFEIKYPKNYALDHANSGVIAFYDTGDASARNDVFTIIIDDKSIDMPALKVIESIDNKFFFLGPNSNVNQKIISTFRFIDIFKINWVADKDYSYHIGSEKAKFIIKRDDGFTVTKTLVWPVVKNIPHKQILARINNVLDFYEITGGFDEIDAENVHGLMDTSFEVNYDKNNALSLTLYSEYLGAYPSESATNLSINLTNGEVIKLSDIFYQSKTSDLINILNVKLQNNIQENPTGSCSIEDNEYFFKIGKESDQDYGKFTEKNITNFKINSQGIIFIYDFGFNHASQACEPDGMISLSYEQLKNYIRTDGLLGSEVK